MMLPSVTNPSPQAVTNATCILPCVNFYVMYKGNGLASGMLTESQSLSRPPRHSLQSLLGKRQWLQMPAALVIL